MTRERKKLVLVGNGMAGVRTIEHVLKLSPGKYEITIFGTEPHPNYNRIQLSSILAGKADQQDIVMNDWQWYEDNGISIYAGEEVTHIDPQKQEVHSASGRTATYDELILATGSRPFILPLPGNQLEGVLAFRNLEDCEQMMAASRTYKKAAVIGGGLLGLEAARGLLNLGMDVTVIHIFPYLMERQLDEPAAKMLQKELEEQGMKFLMGKQTESIVGKKRVTGLRFKDGGYLAADLVVMAVGIRPNVELAAASGIQINRGIVVNDHLETNVPHIYAVGECAEHRGIAYGLVAPLYEQGAVLAKRLAGVETQGYTGSTVSTKLKVSGIKVFSAGQYEDATDTVSLRYQDELERIYKKLVFKDGRLIGAVLFGDTSDSAQLLRTMKSGTSMKGKEKELLLGETASSNQAVSMLDKTAAMPMDEIVCGCNGVTKAAILNAIQTEGCSSVKEIRACTKASASCGGCQPIVEQLLQFAGKAVSREKEGICGCTVLDRDAIVAKIKEMRLTSVKEVMHVLDWSTPEGCSKCRPALNYYLGMLWPEAYEDERESRFANERFHANIQKDGTFSVVPRIYGGVTSPKELKKIADIAEKYEVPMVKITGGQRLDLLGVKKEVLPNIWEELDMPSGYAYGKAVRTVKTCVGSTFCRFGTQDSIAMGIAMEKHFERLNTPAKVKMAVSGCPRNCAEATIKDLGVVAVEGAWEIHVGGNGGVHVRATELLCVVKTEEEVMEWTAAYLQYYRENARWNERTSVWIERIGLDTVKKALSKQEDRLALKERLELALGVLKDPWKEIVRSEELQKSFKPIQTAAHV